GELPNVRDLDEPSLTKRLSELAAQHDLRREHELLERWRAQAGRGELGGTLDEVLAAVSDARVETLLVSPGGDPDVCVCPHCGRLSDHAQLCPVDGNFIQAVDAGLEPAVSSALARGGAVWELHEENRVALAGSGGVGAVARF